MSAMMFFTLMLAAGCVVAFIFMRPREDAQKPRAPAIPAKPMLLQIAFQADGCCEAAKLIQSQRFEKQRAPVLPLTACTMGQTCRCLYRQIPERRYMNRRSGKDKRVVVRFEDQNPRRMGYGRRKEDNLWKDG